MDKGKWGERKRRRCQERMRSERRESGGPEQDEMRGADVQMYRMCVYFTCIISLEKGILLHCVYSAAGELMRLDEEDWGKVCAPVHPRGLQLG